MKIKNSKDFFAGLIFIALGVSFAIGAGHFEIGTASAMGPGFFPRMLGIILSGMGFVITLTSLFVKPEEDDEIGRWPWRQILFILGGTVVFGLALNGLKIIGLPPLGLIVAIFMAVSVSSFADKVVSPKIVLLLSSILSVGSYLIFVKLIGLSFRVWPWFIPL